jgi:transposase
MDIVARHRSDRERLRRLLRTERNATQRDRLRAVVLALQGDETLVIAIKIGRGRTFVQRWVYAYRDHGIEGIHGRKRPGRRPFLSPEEERQFAERLDRGAQPEDGVSTIRGKDMQQIVKLEFGKLYSLSGMYNVLRRLGYSYLGPRPRHPGHDPKAVQRFRRSAPIL